jgi:hypothetical protein
MYIRELTKSIIIIIIISSQIFFFCSFSSKSTRSSLLPVVYLEKHHEPIHPFVTASIFSLLLQRSFRPFLVHQLSDNVSIPAKARNINANELSFDAVHKHGLI